MTWPFENDTGAVVKKLAKRSLQSEKRRDLMVVIAVALAAFLLCFAGTLAISVLQIQSDQVMDTYEAVYTDVSEQDVKALRDLPEAARVGEYYLIGEEHSPRGFSASFVYGDADLIYIARRQMELTTGRMPEAADEIVVSESWLSAYAPALKPGEAVTLDTETFKGDFTVCGIMDALLDENAGTYPFLISKSALRESNGYRADGYRAYVHLLNDTQLDRDQIETYCRQAAKDRGLPMPGFNSAYFRYAEKTASFEQAPVLALLAGVVLIGAYIVIQSIFRISIQDKIQSYGQLRTIGATRRQIKRMVKKEGRKLGGIGISAGTVLGVCCSFLLFPDGFQLLRYAAVMLLSALICWFMTAFSIRRPVRIAAGISPIEAVRFTPEQKRVSRSRKTPAKLNPLSLGVMNFRRDRKKTVSIAASLSLGAIALLVVSSMLLVMSPEKKARQYFPDGDYKVYIDSERKHSDILKDGNPLTQELKQELLSIDGVQDIIVKRRSSHAQFSTPDSVGSGMCDILTEQNLKEVEQALVAGTMPADGHSIVLAEGMAEDMTVGATLELSLGEKTGPVTVSGLFDLGRLHEGHKKLGLDGSMLYATEALFKELLPGIENYDYSWSIVSDPKKAQSVEAALKSIAAGRADIGVDSIAVRRDYLKYQNTMVFGGMKAVSWLIFLFGVVNLINTTLSNQLSRKRENRILRSVGLTPKQLYAMIVSEGLCHALSAMLATLIVGLPIAVCVCRLTGIAAYGGEIIAYQFPFPEMGLFLMVLFALEFLLSLWTSRKQERQPIAEQI